ncbi:MAG: hypothetical protein U0U70_08360 [Chitinophagaceae bacterium]
MKLIFQLLESADERQQKRGLQDFCDFLENGLIIDEDERIKFYFSLSKLKKSPNILVRRWLYKTIGLLKARILLPYLKEQLKVYETDEENKAWIISTLYHLLEKAEAYQFIKTTNIDSKLFLAAGFFEPEFLPKDIKIISKIIDHNDSLQLRWFGLLYGNSIDKFQIDEKDLTDRLTRLNRHEDNVVAEYSVWALHKSNNGSFADSEFSPQEVDKCPPNVRRWLYRLIAKDIQTLSANFEVLESAAFNESDVSAREGLAIGVGKFGKNQTVKKLIIRWFEFEQNAVVRLQLLKSIADNAGGITEYQRILREEISNPFDRISRTIAEIGLINIKSSFVIQSEMEFEEKMKKILIVIATDLELDVMVSKFKEFNSPKLFPKGDMVFWDLGKLNNCEIFLVKSGMGTSGVQGSLITVTKSIEHLNPDYIIMLGIAYGLKEDKQNLTEILVSKQLQSYELSKVGPTDIIPRADKIPASVSLVSRFENCVAIWKGVKVHFGFIVSGDKLSNNESLVIALKKIFPEAIGAEMEGTGLQSISHRDKKDWILVKGICDWGYNKDDKYQKEAMENVVDFFIHTVRQVTF